MADQSEPMGRDERSNPHAESASQVASRLKVDPSRGLSDREVVQRRERSGINELTRVPPTSAIVRILVLLAEPMALLLVVAAGISAIVLDELVEGMAISAIVVLNAGIAFAQENKAQRALEALRQLETPHARVLRDGRIDSISAVDLVEGDVIILSEGDRVPADARLFETVELTSDESSLTGESGSVRKDAGRVGSTEETAADQVNMVFSSCLIDHGSGKAIVTATGDRTEIGRIAGHLSQAKPSTPLQIELTRLTKTLGTVAIDAAALAFLVSLLHQGMDAEALQKTFLAAVALAVAAVPEGLATVVTVALALGVARMARRGAIVRRLSAVETLGATTIIATDKTGTLTRNEFEVVDAWIPSAAEEVRAVCALCSDASLEPDTGDKLEIALLRWVGSSDVERLRAEYQLIDKRPFDSDRKLMSVLVRTAQGSIFEFVKGAPEEVLLRSVALAEEAGGSLEGLQQIDEICQRMAAEGQKVLALAIRRQDDGALGEIETGLTVVGVIGLGDPVRPEARTSVGRAHEAGVGVLMVTGDHAGTARAIAAQVGLPDKGVMTGRELMAAGTLADPLEHGIYARVTPEQKLFLVRALQDRGDVVAVTGDGVNDAPALHQADIGVAMGLAGTDVAKEAADIVITDDNLGTIVTAIREGRGIYDNIRRVVEYLVAANISEIAVVLTGLILFPDLGAPLLPLQLLWINLVTDGLPAIALGIDPVAEQLMQSPPRRRSDGILSRARLQRLTLRGSIIAASCLGALAVARFVWNEPWSHARGLMFTTIALAQLFYAFAVRRPQPKGGRMRSALERITSNRWLLVGAGGGILLQVLAIWWSPTRRLLGAAPLSAREWLLVAAASLVPAMAIAALSPGPGLSGERHLS